MNPEMDRNELGKHIENGLRESLNKEKAKELDRLISKGLMTKSNIFRFPLFESGWHVETTGSESLFDLAKKRFASGLTSH